MPNNDNEINVLPAKRRDISKRKIRTCDRKRREKKWKREKENEVSVDLVYMRKNWERKVFLVFSNVFMYRVSYSLSSYFFVRVRENLCKNISTVNKWRHGYFFGVK